MELLYSFFAATENTNQALLESPVIATAITAIFAFLGVVVTLRVSNKKKPKRFWKRPSNDTPIKRLDDHLTFSGYEALIKELNAEILRLRALAVDREKMIDLYRARDDRHFAELDKKNEEIARLKHLREYAVHAQKLAEDNN